MKQLSHIIVALLATLLTITIGYGQNTETRDLSAFHGISVSSSVSAEIMKGSENKIEIRTQGVETEKVDSDISNGILKVGMKRNWSKGGNWTKRTRVKVKITYTDELDYIGAGSSSDLVSNDVITSDNLEVKVSSSADMAIEVDVNELEISTSSSADLEIEGTANKAEVSASSSSDIDGRDLTVKHANIKASSSADISIGVTDSIKAKASSSADIVYYGNPEQRDISKSSGADIDQKRGR